MPFLGYDVAVQHAKKSGHVEDTDELMTGQLPEIHAKNRTDRQTDFHVRPGEKAALFAGLIILQLWTPDLILPSSVRHKQVLIAL
jgi:hypothetical protein